MGSRGNTRFWRDLAFGNRFENPILSHKHQKLVSAKCRNQPSYFPKTEILLNGSRDIEVAGRSQELRLRVDLTTLFGKFFALLLHS
jgi:hypothetical protein